MPNTDHRLLDAYINFLSDNDEILIIAYSTTKMNNNQYTYQNLMYAVGDRVHKLSYDSNDNETVYYLLNDKGDILIKEKTFKNMSSLYNKYKQLYYEYVLAHDFIKKDPVIGIK